MANEQSNENQLPSYLISSDINDRKLQNLRKNMTKKRTFSESEDQYEVYDQNLSKNTSNKIKKNKICLENQSNILNESNLITGICDHNEKNYIECNPDFPKDCDEQDLILTTDSEILAKSQSDAIKKLTKQIEHIEYKVFTCKTSIEDTNKHSQSCTKNEIVEMQKSSYNLFDEFVFDEKITDCKSNIVDTMKKKSILTNEVDALLLKPSINGGKNISKDHKTITIEIIENEINNINPKSQTIREKKLLESLEQISNDLMLDKKDMSSFKINENKICAGISQKSIYGHEEKLSESVSIQYLEDKTVLEDENNSFSANKTVLEDEINSFSANEDGTYGILINQESPKPSKTYLYDITLDDTIIPSTKINDHQINKSRDSISTDHLLMKQTKHLDDLIMLDSDIIGDKLFENKLTSCDGQFTSDMFFFGSENCRDVPVYNISTIKSPKSFITSNCSKNNLSTYSEKKCASSSNSFIECNQSINNFVNEVVIDSHNLSLASNDKNLSFAPSEVKKSFENPNSSSEGSDISILFRPSNNDLLKYLVNLSSSEEEKSTPESQNDLSNIVSNDEKLCLNTSKSKLKSSEEFINNTKINGYKGFVKDFEDNVTYFYDCDLSSIENSDAEDNHLKLSFEDEFEDESSLNLWNYEKNIDETETIKYSSLNDQSKYSKQNKLELSTKSYDTTTVMENHNSSLDSSNNHKYFKSLSGNVSKKQNHDSGVSIVNNMKFKTTNNCTKSGSKHLDQINIVDINTLHEDHLRDDSEINKTPESKEYKNFDNRDILDEKLDVDKSISLSKTIGKFSEDIEFESLNQLNMKASYCSNIPKFNDIVDTIDTNQCDSSYIDQNGIINKLDEDNIVSPFISKSVSINFNSQNLKKALIKKATTNISLNSMGNKALCTYRIQQTMTLDVLKILHESLDKCPLPDVLEEDPKGLVVPLMPHQKHAIAWLLWRENQKPCGGILADDMGLGKTLSMISLVLKSEETKPTVPVESNDIISGGTLVVCPTSLLNQWENEVKTKLCPELLKVGQYYGVNRNIISASELAKYDIVTTSYHIVMWDFKKRQYSSPLFKINWKRIILDEAHVIRNHQTQTCFAVCNLTSIHRWAITGTPIHNKEADFFTLLKFIRCKPFDNWTIWKRWVGNNDDTGRHRQSLLVKTLMLRRTKEELSQFSSFKLPDKMFCTVEVELSKEERNAYEQLLKFSSKLFATYLFERAEKEKVFDHSVKVQCTVQYFQEKSINKEEIFKDHPELQKLFNQFKNIKEIQTYHILVLLLRLRQMCCHPSLIKGKVSEENIDMNEKDNIILDDENVKDNGGKDSVSSIEKSIIDHTKDLSLIEELTDSMSCLNLDESKSNQKIEPIDSDFIFKTSWLSSKIKAVCDTVRDKVLINDCKEKAIIVSQWPSMLRIIRQHLSRFNCEMEMYSGDVSILKRSSIVNEFNNSNGGPQILLLSLKAGGVGLNLMAANHLFLVDVHWNPQLEAQACDRIYRLGQIKPVNIYKFICKNTIETRILMIQSHKLEIAQALFESVKVSSSNITIDDLKHIFQCA